MPNPRSREIHMRSQVIGTDLASGHLRDGESTTLRGKSARSLAVTPDLQLPHARVGTPAPLTLKSVDGSHRYRRTHLSDCLAA